MSLARSGMTGCVAGVAGYGLGKALGTLGRAGGVVEDVARGEGQPTKEIIERKSLGADNARSRHIIEKLDGETISVTHQVERNGQIIHQHQTHIGKHGTLRRFPEEWVEYPTIDLP